MSQGLPPEEQPQGAETTEGFTLPAPFVALPATEPLTPKETITIPARHNPTLQRVLERINEDADLHAIWRCQNVTAVDRLGMTDHGPVHMQIVANSALRLLRLLNKAGVVASAVERQGLTEDDAEVIVVLGALLHDAGMSITRGGHEEFSLIIALPKLMELLEGIYEPGTRRVVVSETLHAIISHRAGGQPLTIEAGIVRVADALDMAKGRSRIPFEAGAVNIHSVSAAAIDGVEIVSGEVKPIRVNIAMTNAAGLYQLDELLKEKLRGSGLEPYVEISAQISGEADKRIFETFTI
jgi:metal-dependent HD superfamily phosphatase/phosphodiesterase